MDAQPPPPAAGGSTSTAEAALGKGVHDGAGDLHQLWYDDAKTYAKKMEAAKQMGVRALGIWQAEGAGPHPEVTEALWAAVPGPAQKMDDDWTKVAEHDVGVTSTGTVSLMTEPLLGDFEPDGWQGYARTFAQWTACVKSGPACSLGSSPCQQCRSKRGAAREAIRCLVEGSRTKFFFPPGGIFPVVEQFTVPANTEIHGAANPNDGGFDNMRIEYRDDTVLEGSCNYTIPGC
eukprot:COSAG04_NODE_796_length_10256_cov_46.383479_6_plen_233_part_00